MTLEEAKRHAEHLCNVWPIDENDEHCGVIEEVSVHDYVIAQAAIVKVSGHPTYGTRWFFLHEIETNCQIED